MNKVVSGFGMVLVAGWMLTTLTGCTCDCAADIVGWVDDLDVPARLYSWFGCLIPSCGGWCGC